MLVRVPIILVSRKVGKVYADQCYLSQSEYLIITSQVCYAIAEYYNVHPECELNLTW